MNRFDFNIFIFILDIRYPVPNDTNVYLIDWHENLVFPLFWFSNKKAIVVFFKCFWYISNSICDFPSFRSDFIKVNVQTNMNCFHFFFYFRKTISSDYGSIVSATFYSYRFLFIARKTIEPMKVNLIRSKFKTQSLTLKLWWASKMLKMCQHVENIANTQKNRPHQLFAFVRAMWMNWIHSPEQHFVYATFLHCRTICS